MNWTNVRSNEAEGRSLGRIAGMALIGYSGYGFCQSVTC